MNVGVTCACARCFTRYWNKVNFEGMKQSFADGGGTDNLAVTPLLRRKVWGPVGFCRCWSMPLGGTVARGLLSYAMC